MLWNDENKINELGENGFEIVKERYSVKAYYVLLIKAYHNMIITPKLEEL